MPKQSLKNKDKRLKNLKPWKPGQSGNPKGRPPKLISFTSLLKEEITRVNQEDKEKRTWAQLIVIATMKLAIKGNAAALREVWERIDGKTKNTPLPEEIKLVFKGCSMPGQSPAK